MQNCVKRENSVNFDWQPFLTLIVLRDNDSNFWVAFVAASCHNRLRTRQVERKCS